MLTFSAENIIIAADRQRKEFPEKAMIELMDSIQAHGLFHPVVVRCIPDSPGHVQLVAGERRLRAIKEIYELYGKPIRCNAAEIPFGLIPCLTLGDLSPLEAEEAELDENLRRDDLTWQEHSAALARLHALRQAQAAEKSTPEAPVKHTVADTAKEVKGRSDGSFSDSVRKELILAKHLNNPEVAKAKTVDEAFKVLKNQEERKKNEALAAEVGLSFNSAVHTLLHGDCLKLLASPQFEDKFNVICSDPLYGMDAHKFGDAAGRMTHIQHHYEDTYENWKRIMLDFALLSMRVTKAQAHMYLFCDLDRFHELKQIMQDVGWYVFRTPLVYIKTGGGRVPLPELGPRRCYELCLYAIKGSKPVTHIYPDIIQAAADTNESHGAQKTVAVFQNLLQRSVCPGDQILDPFGGTGTLALAAHALKCAATVIELEAEYYGIACKRVKALG